jgi:RNA polymerase sigma-70 factor (ECF subfamily)
MGSTVLNVMSSSPPLTTATLLVRAREGESEARQELAREAGRTAYVFALQLTGRPDVARDVAQESLVRLFDRLDRFDPRRPLEPWLFTIVRNQVRDHARRERVRRHESLDAWLESGGQRAATAATDPAALAEQAELARHIWKAVSGLSAAHREIVVLRDYHDLSYREIAAVLAIPEGTVMSRLHAARMRLREELRGER